MIFLLNVRVTRVFDKVGRHTASERVGGKEEEGCACYHFYYAVNSCCKEACICALSQRSEWFQFHVRWIMYRNAQILEDCGCIIVDCVAKTVVSGRSPIGVQGFLRSSHLLANHDTNGDESSISISPDGPHLTLKIPKRSTTD